MGNNIAILQYNAGNVQSVLYALERIGHTAVVTNDADALKAADKVIVPGVGEAGSAMQYLQEHGLDTLIKSLTQPVLGICLGMQLMCSHSEEGYTTCLGIFDEPVRKFTGQGIKVPQIGWNMADQLQSPLFANMDDTCWFYFVHSFYAPLGRNTIAVTDYGTPYSSALHKNNFYGVQFHPEKSAKAGEQLLANFLAL
jgi:imidazole glycerol-phosphate synthase subunit HisH